LAGVPLVTALATYALARQGEIRAGREELAREAIDDAFERAFLAQSFRAEQALQAFEHVLALSPDNAEAIAGIALVKARATDVAPGRAHLGGLGGATATQPTVQRARAYLLRLRERYGTKEEYLRTSPTAESDARTTQLGEAAAPFELFLEALPPFPAL